MISRRLPAILVFFAILVALPFAPTGWWARVPTAARRAARLATAFALRRFVFIVTLLALAGFVWIYAGTAPPSPIVRSDGQGYFVYLPAYVIYHDPTLRAVAADVHNGDPTAGDLGKGLNRDPVTHNYLERYGIGEAVMMLPFFLAGHAMALVAYGHSDGYTPIEQVAAGLSGLFYMCAGAWVLRRLLLRHFSPGVTLATLASIVFGTNLFHYGTYDGGFSHVYSFFLISLLMLVAPTIFRARVRTRDVVGLGVVAGMIVLVRNPNAVVLLAVPLTGVVGSSDVAARWGLIRHHPVRFLLAGAVAFLVFLPQMIAWHIETGKWLVSSYQGDPGAGFHFLHPTFPDVLLSFFPHGLLPWAPILAFAFVGFIPLLRLHRELFSGAIVVVIITIYLVACWWVWHYGGGFGHRGFVDILVFFALPLAAFYEWLPGGPIRAAFGVVAAELVLATSLQMVHYWQGLVPIGGMPPHEYFQVLLGGKPPA